MRLKDFAVAIRTGRSAANGGLSCSIDPTAEGMKNLQQFVTADPGRSGHQRLGRRNRIDPRPAIDLS